MDKGKNFAIGFIVSSIVIFFYFIVAGFKSGYAWYILAPLLIILCIVGTILLVRFFKKKKQKKLEQELRSLQTANYKAKILEETTNLKILKEKTKCVQQIVNILDHEVRTRTFEKILSRLYEIIKNEKLTKICYNFITENNGLMYIDYFINYDSSSLPQHDESGEVLLYPFITKARFLCFDSFKHIKPNNDISNIITISNNAFLYDTIRWASTGAAEIAFDLKYNPILADIPDDDDEPDDDELDENNDYYKIFFFMKLLYDNNLISNNFEDKQAIIYLLWILHKTYLENQLEARYEQYGLDKNLTTEEKVEKMYSIAEDDILSVLTIDAYLTNMDKPILLYRDDLIHKIKPMIKNAKDKAKLNRLEHTVNNQTLTTIEDIDLMTGSEFEEFVAKLFRQMGYTTEVTKASGDQGIDVIAKKNNYVVAIQAKCYNGVVGNHAIMEAVAGTKFYNANKCMVITNNYFTKSARDLANVNNVQLWDREVLSEKIKNYC